MAIAITHNPYACPLCRMRWATAPEFVTTTARPVNLTKTGVTR